MLTWIRDNLKDLKPENFYKKFAYSHNTRKQAEEKLRELLTAINNEYNLPNRKKAKFLLDNFESWTQSIDCEKYWLDVEASLGRSAHEVAGRISAYNTIKNFVKKINDEEKDLNEFQPSKNPEPRTPENKIIKDPENNPFLVRSNDSDGSWSSECEYERTTEGDEVENSDFEEQDSDEDTDINVSGTTGAKLTDTSRTEYENMYENMCEEMKWRLKSGRCVEDVIYEFGCSCLFEDLSHSFIIDLEDRQIMRLFTIEEREEIKSNNIKHDPEPEDDVIACLSAFNKTNVHDIREVMGQFSTCQGIFSTDVIIYAIHSLVLLYERQPNALSIDHLENWYNVNLWGPIVDKAFGNITGVDIVRGESCSIASSDRKNRKRKRTKRKALGRRSDAIIRKNTNGQTLEFGGSEVGRFYNSKMGSKWLVESGLKLPKMLRDMFTALCDRVKWRADIIQKLETVGYIHGGRVMMLMSLDNPDGYVMRLTKGNIFEIPEDVESFALALELISAVWMFKSRVQRTMKLVQNIPLDLKKVGLVNHKAVVKNKFSATFTTPRKPKKPCRK